MFERFTTPARRVVVCAQEEARLLRHDHIGTEHLLLGLLRDDAGGASRALQAAGVTAPLARRQLEEPLDRGKRESSSGHIPLTANAKRALERGLRESMRLGHHHICPVHLLRGLINTREGQAVRMLLALGVDLDQLAAAALEHLAADPDARAGPDRPQHAASRMPAIATRLAVERRRLARGLERYGRHEEGCDPDVGCTCGLGPLLALAGQDEQLSP